MNTKSLAIISLFAFAGCAYLPNTKPSAVANLSPTAGNNVTGTIKFTQLENNKVHVEGTVTGLTPGQHGFHIHEKGDCSAPDASSAGGHFNPSGRSHGNATSAERHGGDLGNLTADSNGNATVHIEVDNISAVSGVANSVIGRGLIVHADPDDFKTQPTGNSGKRLSCAVIASN